MTGSAIAAFLAVDLLLVLTPGADWAYAITAGLGGRPVLPAVVGLVAGYAGYTVVVMAGLAVLVAHTPGLLTALTIVGALYLVWLGGSTLARPTAISAGTAATWTGPWRAVARGAGVSGLNPKGLLLFLALLPQFAHPGTGWPIADQIGLLGLLHMIDCAIVYSAVGMLARVLLASRPTAARVFIRCSGAVMIGFGVALVLIW